MVWWEGVWCEVGVWWMWCEVQFDIIIYLFRTVSHELLSSPSPPPCPARAVYCALLSARTHWMLSGACNPMVCPIRVLRNPKVIGRWTLQLAAAGARDRGVFEAAAAACLRAIARGMATKAAGSSKGTKGCILNLGLIFPLFLLRAGCHRLPPQACDVIVLLFFPCFFFYRT